MRHNAKKCGIPTAWFLLTPDFAPPRRRRRRGAIDPAIVLSFPILTMEHSESHDDVVAIMAALHTVT
jgi:hypothetical protein